MSTEVGAAGIASGLASSLDPGLAPSLDPGLAPSLDLLLAPSLNLLPLAHAGEGATWQALLTLLSLGLVAVLALAVAGVVTLDEPGDLILPLAGTAVLASLSGATSTVLSDWVGWAFPLGVVALLALVVAATSPLRLGLASPLTAVAVVVAVGAALLLQDPITRAWHPREIGPPSAPIDDLALEIVEPADGATVPAGEPIDLVVRASGGTLGQGFVDAGQGPDDPEQQVAVTISLVPLSSGQTASTVGAPQQDCSNGCEQATYRIEIPDPGEWTIYVEAKAADGRSFTAATGASGAPTTRVTVEAQ